MNTYDPDGTLVSWLELHVQNYEADFRAYWHLDAVSPPSDLSATDWALARLLDQVGGKMMASAQQLRLHPELVGIIRDHSAWESADFAAADLVNYHIAHARAEIDLAWSAVWRLSEGKKRLAIVMVFLSQFTLSERAAAFVDRMVQCFVWGLDTEMTVMARAVVEAALEERIPEVQLASLGIRKPNRWGYNFKQYLDAARRLNIVDAAALTSIGKIREAGNAAVHAVPGIHPSAIRTLVDTVLCLRALFPDPS
jgi:hypothetical protein